MPPIRNLDFIFAVTRSMIQLCSWRIPQGAGGRMTMESTRQRSEGRSLIARMLEWLSEVYERAQVRDHDRYVAAAGNAREVSQRLHRIEQGADSFHA
jgi:hypothetical protein